MSGIGKTVLCQRLKDEGCYHYGVDYRIGSKYLRPLILSEVSRRMSHDAWVSGLLSRSEVALDLRLSLNDISVIGSYLGVLGSRDYGGLSWDDFIRRQDQYGAAERASMLDSVKFLDDALAAGHKCLLVDATGSLSQVLRFGGSGQLDTSDPLVDLISDRMFMVNLEASPSDESKIIDRALADPKPMYYDRLALAGWVDQYLRHSSSVSMDDVKGEDFIRWVFPLLIKHRRARAEQMVAKFGVSVMASDIWDLIESGSSAWAALSSVVSAQLSAKGSKASG